MADPAPLHALRRPLTVTVHGDMGLVNGEIVEFGASVLRFWCREDLLEGSRHDLRVDLGPGAGNADLEVVIRKQEGPWTGRGRGFGHEGTWSGSPRQRQRLLQVVQAQLPDVWLDVAPATPSPAARPAARPAPPPAPPPRPRSASVRGYAVMVAPGSPPTVAVTLPDAPAVRTALRVRDGRAVVRLGDAQGLEARQAVLLVLALPDGTYQQHRARVVRTRAGPFARSEPLDAAARRHLEGLVQAAGVQR